jgi:hypothetical protein
MKRGKSPGLVRRDVKNFGFKDFRRIDLTRDFFKVNDFVGKVKSTLKVKPKKMVFLSDLSNFAVSGGKEMNDWAFPKIRGRSRNSGVEKYNRIRYQTPLVIVEEPEEYDEKNSFNTPEPHQRYRSIL